MRDLGHAEDTGHHPLLARRDPVRHVTLLVLTENPLVLYPLAIVSSLGVVFLLTCVYTMLVLLLTGRENHVEGWGQLIVPALAGFTLALLQIAALDVIRYALTGTWSGFAL